MKTRLEALRDRLLATYWFVPAIMCTAAIMLSEVALWFDNTYASDWSQWLGWTYGGKAQGASSLLSTVASSTITVTGVTFSLTIVTLTLAAQQFGPGLLGNFMRDRGNQIVLGTFTSIYLYCLLILRQIREDSTPQLSVTIGVALAVVGIAVLIYFIHHVAESIHVTEVLDRIGKQLDKVLDDFYPEVVGDPASSRNIGPLPAGEMAQICAENVGYVIRVDAKALVGSARSLDIIVKLIVRPGDHVTPGQLIAEVWPSEKMSDDAEKSVRSALVMGSRRTPTHDPEFAIRQVVEVALRALSPSVNDPFTAMLCIDRLAASMIRLGERRLPPQERFDEDGNLRVIASRPSHEELVSAAFDPIAENSRDSPLVQQRLRTMIRRIMERTSEESLRQALSSRTPSVHSR